MKVFLQEEYQVYKNCQHGNGASIKVQQYKSKLQNYLAQIELLLAEKLQLKLKKEQILIPINSCVDFLGCIHNRLKQRKLRLLFILRSKGVSYEN